MKNKRLAIFAVGMILWCGTVFAETSLKNVQDSFGTFSSALAKSLPFNSSVGLNWSDAYIGQLLDLPPHFGVGVSGGFTTMNFDAVNGLLKNFNLDKLPLDVMLQPGYTVEGRIGGFILPFDIGVKIGGLPDVNLGNVLQFKYLLAGADFRYALLKGGVILPAISVGFGVNYLSGSIGAKIGNGMSFTVPNTSDKLSLSAPTARFSWETVNFELKAQISKSLFIITPYFGVGVSYALSKAGYGIESKLSYNNQPITDADFNTIKKNVSGLDKINANGFESMSEVNGFGLRAFGGLSLNLAVVKLDLTGMFNFLDQNWGGTLGLRVQL